MGMQREEIEQGDDGDGRDEVDSQTLADGL
jgi:hypothetical protein